MNELESLQVQAIELKRLLDGAKDDPILVPQLLERLQDITVEINDASKNTGEMFIAPLPQLPRAAIFLKGGGVQGQEGIRPALAGESLIQYEKMFTEQALHDERIAARTAGRHRRRRGAPVPGLLFTGTPRGSFGLEFVPQSADDPTNLEVHAQSLKNVATAIMQVGKAEDIESIPPRVLRALKRFMNVLSEHNAAIRLAFSDGPSLALSAEQIKSASDRLKREIEEEEIELHGVFQGLTFETLAFDLLTDDRGLISGTVADGLTEDDLDRLHSLTHRQCIAVLQKTTVHRVDVSTSSYLLLGADEEEGLGSGDSNEIGTPPGRYRRLQSSGKDAPAL